MRDEQCQSHFFLLIKLLVVAIIRARALGASLVADYSTDSSYNHFLSSRTDILFWNNFEAIWCGKDVHFQPPSWFSVGSQSYFTTPGAFDRWKDPPPQIECPHKLGLKQLTSFLRLFPYHPLLLIHLKNECRRAWSCQVFLVRRVSQKFRSITFFQNVTRVCDQTCQFSNYLHAQRFVGMEINPCGTRKHANTLNFCMWKGVTLTGAPRVVCFSVP